MEIERKFLVDALPPGLKDTPAKEIRQGYLALDAETVVEVRLRAKGDARLLTIKGGRGLTRTEQELDLDEAAFDELWPLTEGRRIDKLRHAIDLEGGLVLELDVYHGALDGLLTVEVEFASEADSEAFTPPDWVGRELTGDDRYANRSLAVDGLPVDPPAART